MPRGTYERTHKIRTKASASQMKPGAVLRRKMRNAPLPMMLWQDRGDFRLLTANGMIFRRVGGCWLYDDSIAFGQPVLNFIINMLARSDAERAHIALSKKTMRTIARKHSGLARKAETLDV